MQLHIPNRITATEASEASEAAYMPDSSTTRDPVNEEELSKLLSRCYGVIRMNSIAGLKQARIRLLVYDGKVIAEALRILREDGFCAKVSDFFVASHIHVSWENLENPRKIDTPCPGGWI